MSGLPALSRARLTAALHPVLRPGDVLIGVRAFSSYAHLALCRQRRLHGLFRVSQMQIVSFRPQRGHRVGLRIEVLQAPLASRAGLQVRGQRLQAGRGDGARGQGGQLGVRRTGTVRDTSPPGRVRATGLGRVYLARAAERQRKNPPSAAKL